jgi:hypothetical protein
MRISEINHLIDLTAAECLAVSVVLIGDAQRRCAERILPQAYNSFGVAFSGFGGRSTLAATRSSTVAIRTFILIRLLSGILIAIVIKPEAKRCKAPEVSATARNPYRGFFDYLSDRREILPNP